MKQEDFILETPPVNYGKIQPKYKFRRFELGSHRFYWGWIGKGINATAKVLKGITSVLDESMPTAKELKMWMRSEENQKIFEESADYGSAVHYATYLYDIRDPKRNFHAFVKGLKYSEKVYREVIAWHNFRMAYPDLDLLLIETPLYFSGMGLECCTTLDRAFKFKGKIRKERVVLTGETYKRNGDGYKAGDLKLGRDGKPLTRVEVEEEEVEEIWIVDLKSNFRGKEKKTLYETHGFQLLVQREAFRQNFAKLSGMKIRMFNFTANEWKTDAGSNTYELTEWVVSGEDFDETVGWSRKVLSVSDVNRFRLYLSAGAEAGVHVAKGYITTFDESWQFGYKGSPMKKVSYLEYATNRLLAEYVEQKKR